MELNPEHALVKRMKSIHDENPESPDLDLLAKILHGQALLAESSPLKNPSEFAALLAKMMERSF